ncbi:MAG TPA: phage tail sheath subtilisin-like domain-containing protein [Methylophilaceae bacterium]|nr:phage tail sheath subtilisin-like domain-containing protein [Methylophilaceae bacterium]
MVSFNTIPNNLRVPLFYAEVDNSQAGYFTQELRGLIIGNKLAAGTGVANTPVLVSKTDEARQLAGVGSIAAKMHELYRLNDSIGEVHLLLVDDPGAGVAATYTITVTGPATGSGTLALYVGATKLQIAVASGDSVTAIAAAIAAAINADTSLPITATAAVGVVTATSRHKGVISNDIRIQTNYRGAAGSEKTPAGITVAVAAGVAGAGTPTLATALAALGDNEYDFIIHPYTDATSLDAFKTFMNDTVGRWAYNRQIYGHVYSAAADTFANLVTLGLGRNDQHHTIAGFEKGVPNPCWEYAAAYGARNAVFIKADPARPTQTGELTGILPAPINSRFILTERQSLLNAGIATSLIGGGTVRIERAITTYQKNSFNQGDPSYLDSETMHTLAYVIRRMRYVITQKYPRHKLGDDGQRFAAGQAIVTPKVIRGELLAEYAAMEELGIVENAKAFNANLIVERDATDPNRVNVLYPPDLVNQLRVFAALAQFRLQYSA